MALTPKQKRFVAEYLVDLNATAAARRAGYSEKTADRIGPELLGKTCVSQEIQDAIKRRNQRTEISQDYVLRKLKEIAEMEASDAQDSVLKFSNKLKALELLGKHVGLFDKRVTVELGESAARAVSTAAEREAVLERMQEVLGGDGAEPGEA